MAGVQTCNSTGVSATACSFPFTYEGGLYYGCAQNVTDVTTADCPYACLLANRSWALCVSDIGELWSLCFIHGTWDHVLFVLTV